jgi:hypothetical protein
MVGASDPFLDQTYPRLASLSQTEAAKAPKERSREVKG